MNHEAVATELKDPYRIRSGDTLSSIARRSGVTVQNLQRWNGIRNPNHIAVGQTLYLSEDTAFGIQVAFLDALRNPISNLSFRIEFDGRTVAGKTGLDGLISGQITKDAGSTVDVWVQDAQRQWQRVTSTVSGYGKKLITLVSGAIVVPASTEPISVSTPKLPPKARPSGVQGTTRQVAPAAKPTGQSSKNNRAVTVKKAKGPQGQPLIVLGVDLPEGLQDHFKLFAGGDISDKKWKEVAALLECEPEVLQAIAKVESGGRSAFWRLNEGSGGHVPAILYERHYFSRLTKRVHDKEHPDISWPTGYRTRKRLGKNDKKMHDGKVDADDIYASYATSYLRLIRAYQLDKDAALQSCSWGKFQIMGSNYASCGALNLEDFINKMCTSDAGQIELLAGFIQNKLSAWKSPKNKKLGKEVSLWEAVKTKNWRAIAFNYNGPAYETHAYHTKLEQAYEQYKKASTPQRS